MAALREILLNAIEHGGGLDPDQTIEVHGLRPGGFGILLARSIVDEMIYSEQGNEVVLVKHTRWRGGPSFTAREPG